MNTNPEIPPTAVHPNILAGIIKRIVAEVIFLVLMMAILFLASGQLNWVWAWVYLGIFIVSALITGSITIPTNPEAVAERGEIKIKEKWDKLVSSFYILAMFLALPLVAGLDVRFIWTPDLSIAWHIAGAVALVIGFMFTSWAMITNAYFSTAVRIQGDRGQTVCTSGPYRFVRHPGYVGYILQALSVSFLLGSLWALIPGIIATVSMIIRTSFEDRMLQAELPGYSDYSLLVRNRLLPGVW